MKMKLSDLPNHLTIFRVFCIPIIILCMFSFVEFNDSMFHSLSFPWLVSRPSVTCDVLVRDAKQSVALSGKLMLTKPFVLNI